MRSMLSGLIGAAALALAAPVQADGVKRVAIVVGANLAPTGRVPLRYAHEDAKAVAKVLTEVGDFQSDDVELLLEPTPPRVLAAIDEAVARLGQGSESLVLFYYSGHSDSTALYPSGEPLQLADLQRRLEDLRISVRLGVIDSCRGGAWTGTKGLQPAPLFDVSAAGALNNVGSALIASSSGVEDAHESELLGGSFFTHHFNAGLRGAADENNDRRVSLGEAFEYAKALTIRDTSLMASATQHPSFRMNLQGRQDLPLTNLERGESWMSLSQDAGPLQVVHLHSGMVLVELPSGTRAARVALPPGRYLVRRRVDGRIYAKEYQVPGGEVTTVREAELALLGDERLAVKGTDYENWRTNYYLLGGIGAQRTLSFAMSESRYGHISSNETPLSGFMGFVVENIGLDLEVAVPGRVGWRFGRGSAFEWIPWLGMPHYWDTDANGNVRFRFGIGGGVDAWLKLGAASRVGLNLGASSYGPDNGSRVDAWAALGYAFEPLDRVTVNVGLGYARHLAHSDDYMAVRTDDQRDRLSLGSVMTDGVLPRPLLEYQVSDALVLGVSAQLDYLLPDGDFGYQATVVWTYRFGRLDMMVKP
jgi:uncharacterized caspase-like protein